MRHIRLLHQEHDPTSKADFRPIKQGENALTWPNNATVSRAGAKSSPEHVVRT